MGYVFCFLNGMFVLVVLLYDLGCFDINCYGCFGLDYFKGMGIVKGLLLGVFMVGGKLIGDIMGSVMLEVFIINCECGWLGYIDVVVLVVSWGSDKIIVSLSLYFGFSKYM